MRPAFTFLFGDCCVAHLYVQKLFHLVRNTTDARFAQRPQVQLSLLFLVFFMILSLLSSVQGVQECDAIVAKQQHWTLVHNHSSLLFFISCCF